MCHSKSRIPRPFKQSKRTLFHFLVSLTFQIRGRLRPRGTTPRPYRGETASDRPTSDKWQLNTVRPSPAVTQFRMDESDKCSFSILSLSAVLSSFHDPSASGLSRQKKSPSRKTSEPTKLNSAVRHARARHRLECGILVD